MNRLYNEMSRCVKHVKQKYDENIIKLGNYVTTESEVGKLNGINRTKES